ncbi:MAG: hypothetical protein HXX10_28475, partial [Rhodoplanes sp.]|nr:hypothetical protein [Rhodoplanes sp.]
PLDARPAGVPVTGPVLGAPGPAAPAAPPAPPLAAVPVGKRPDFLVDLYLATRALRDRGAPGATRVPDPLAEDPTAAPLAATAAAVAARWDAIVAKDDTDAKRAARLVQEVDAALTGDGLLQMGAIADWMTRAGETLRRAGTFPGDAISTVFAELRPAINNLVAAFIGDVLVYLETRGTAGQPGPIQVRVLDALKTAQAHKTATGERIVVVTHSMGGQLLYDALTHFAPADPALAGLVVDHWISCGAQVSYFAEVGVFRGQPGTRAPQKLPRPASVAAWTNYYDRNDLVGFVMAPVFDGVTDIEYDTGYGLAFAHTGYLGRPSFFEAVAARIGG